MSRVPHYVAFANEVREPKQADIKPNYSCLMHSHAKPISNKGNSGLKLNQRVMRMILRS